MCPSLTNHNVSKWRMFTQTPSNNGKIFPTFGTIYIMNALFSLIPQALSVRRFVSIYSLAKWCLWRFGDADSWLFRLQCTVLFTQRGFVYTFNRFWNLCSGWVSRASAQQVCQSVKIPTIFKSILARFKIFPNTFLALPISRCGMYGLEVKIILIT